MADKASWAEARAGASLLFPAVATATQRSRRGIDVLDSPHDITAEWLTGVLRLNDPTSPEVRSLARETLPAGDFDFNVNLVPQYAGDGRGPARILARFARPMPAPRWRTFSELCFQREAAIYTELNEHFACRVPGLLFAAGDAGRFNFLLIDDGRPAAAGGNCERALLEAVLQELAALHGCFLRTSPASAPGWQLRLRDIARHTEHLFRQGLEILRGTRARQMIGGRFDLVEAFAGHVVTWHQFERHVLTLTHGDARVANALFEQCADGRMRASLVGWKLAGLRNPMFDVASLLANDLEPAERARVEADLIALYRHVFEQSGARYPRSAALKDYRFNLFGPLMFNVCASTFLAEDHDGMDRLIARIDRNCRAIADWKSLDLLCERSNVIA